MLLYSISICSIPKIITYQIFKIWCPETELQRLVGAKIFLRLGTLRQKLCCLSLPFLWGSWNGARQKPVLSLSGPLKMLLQAHLRVATGPPFFDARQLLFSALLPFGTAALTPEGGRRQEEAVRSCMDHRHTDTHTHNATVTDRKQGPELTSRGWSPQAMPTQSTCPHKLLPSLFFPGEI